MTKETIGRILKRDVSGYGSWLAYAAHLGVNPQDLHDCKDGRRNPSAKLIAALGLEKYVAYRSKRQTPDQ
jgi:hypothetical protein